MSALSTLTAFYALGVVNTIVNKCRGSAVIGACVALIGCVEPLGTERARSIELFDTRVVEAPPGVTELGSPVAVDYPTGSLWVWDLVAVDDGVFAERAYLWVPREPDPLTAELDLARRNDGELDALIALTAEEEAERATGAPLRLVPLGGFVHDGVGYLYYAKRRFESFFDSELLGLGVCRIPETRDGCVRFESASTTSGELFDPESSFAFDRGGFADDDGFAYLFGCAQPVELEGECYVARVLVDRADDASAYRFYDAGSGAWSPDPADRRAFAEHLGALSVRPNRFWNGYVMLTVDLFDGALRARWAERPESGYGGPRPVLSLKPAEDFAFPGGPLDLAGLSPDDGRTVVALTDEPGVGLSLVSFRFLDGWRGN